MTHNPPIDITVNCMVKMKNLIGLKDGLGPCLDDVNIEQHLPFCGELNYQICHLYNHLEAIKANAGMGVLLSWRPIIAETTSPV
jgi:hypothetical protein